MSELRSALEGFRMETLAEVPDARLEEDFTELHRASELLEAERLRRLAEIDRRRLYEREGHLSAAAWLASRFRMAWGWARRDLHLARSLEQMPETFRGFRDGDLSESAVRVLVEARGEDPEAFGKEESRFVEAARVHQVGELRKVAAYWRQAVERHAALDGKERLRERRRLHASVTLMGMVRVDADLDPETGETLLTALRAVLDAEARQGQEDRRTPAQRRADALGEVCRGWLDHGERPRVAGERPHLTVTVGEDVLRDGGGSPSEGDHVGPIDPEVVRRISCDASVRRVVLAGTSEPLDVGRRTPVVPPGIRRAVVVRDGGCRFPGCDRPHTWCDAHHVVHWADGGPTAVQNLVLLCRRHHRMVHARGGFRLGLEDGRPVFRRPDGDVLEGRAPP